MKRYFISILVLSFSGVLHGAASSSGAPGSSARPGNIIFNQLPHPVWFYQNSENMDCQLMFHKRWESNIDFCEKIVRECNGVRISDAISEPALQNSRRKTKFPTKFTLRYRKSDGTWDCRDAYVLPQQFNYRSPDQTEINAAETRLFLCGIMEQAPTRRFGSSLYDLCKAMTFGDSEIPSDISMYLEVNRFDGPLLPSVSRYFERFPNLGYLSLKRLMIQGFGANGCSHFEKDVLAPVATFNRMQSADEDSLSSDVQWDTAPVVTIGEIPPFPAASFRSRKSLEFLECLKPWQLFPNTITGSFDERRLVPIEAPYRVIDLRNHAIDIEELRSHPPLEGALWVLSSKDNVENWFEYGTNRICVKAQITEVEAVALNEHFAKQISWQRKLLDTLYNWRYYVAAGAAAIVVGIYVQQHHAIFVADRLKAIDAITDQMNVQKKAYKFLKALIESAQDKQAVAQMTADEMRAALTAHIEIKAVYKEWDRLVALKPSSWTLLHSLFAAIKNKIGTITSIGTGTYAADVCAKYFLGYRPYLPSRIYLQNDFHDYFANKIPYCETGLQPGDGGRAIQRGYCCDYSSSRCDIQTFWSHRERNFDAILPHYDAATEQWFDRNKNCVLTTALAAATAGVLYGLYSLPTANA